MNSLFSCFLLSLLLLSGSIHANSLENETLVTIHGFLGTPYNMYYLAKPLKKEKMLVAHWGYSSRDKTIRHHAEDLVSYLKTLALASPGKPIHFLAHSMGGLILRSALNHPECPAEAQRGAAILVGTPNGGSAWARRLGEFSIVQSLVKDQSGKELMTEMNFDHLGEFPQTMRVMVIAGNFSMNFFLAGENDGTVMVEETYLKTPHQHVILKQGHKSILFSNYTAGLAKNFLLENCK